MSIYLLSCHGVNEEESSSLFNFDVFRFMDLLKAIASPPSKAQSGKIVKFVGGNRERFDQLLQIFLDGPYRHTQRAAGPLSYCIEAWPSLAVGKISVLLSAAEKTTASEAVKRNVVRLLQFAEIPKRNHGKVVDLCSKFLGDKSESIAVRVFSMTVLARMSEIYPELKSDLRLMIEEQLPYGSPAFLSRSRKVLKQIRE